MLYSKMIQISERRPILPEESERADRIRRFAELSDYDQVAALQMVELLNETPKERISLALALLREPTLTANTKQRLFILVQDVALLKLRSASEQAVQDDLAYYRARDAAFSEIQRLTKKHWSRNARKYRTVKEDLLTFFTTVLADTPSTLVKTAAVVALLQDDFRNRGEQVNFDHLSPQGLVAVYQALSDHRIAERLRADNTLLDKLTEELKQRSDDKVLAEIVADYQRVAQRLKDAEP